MGSITSRQNAAVEEADISANHAYKYPPRAGTVSTKQIVCVCFFCAIADFFLSITFHLFEFVCASCVYLVHYYHRSFDFRHDLLGTYFGSHFIMGGERFDTPQPESYLFGENGDLNFLGNRPTAVSLNF